MEQNITMERARYIELVEAELKLKLIEQITKADTSAYGYSDGTSKMIDTVLGIKREEK